MINSRNTVTFFVAQVAPPIMPPIQRRLKCQDKIVRVMREIAGKSRISILALGLL
jgi:hypothetical protein